MLMMWVWLKISLPDVEPPRPKGVRHRLGVLLGVAVAAVTAFYAAGGEWHWTVPPPSQPLTSAQLQPAHGPAAAAAADPATADPAAPAAAPDAAAGMPLVAEEVFARQAALMQRALAGVAPATAQAPPQLYFVAFAADGEQDVFLKEARYSRKLFEERFGARQHSLVLANNRASVGELPLASVTNLRQALAAIGQRMNPERDILFLFLDGHGAGDGSLSVQLGGLGFLPLTPAALAQMLKDAGIRWKVILVSGCFSGSFVPALDDGRTLVMTAAGAGRRSFGCSDDADFTWFGRAYFAQALQQTRSFAQAFARARRQVAQWEARDHYPPSEPQMVDNDEVEMQLERWRGALAGHRRS